MEDPIAKTQIEGSHACAVSWLWGPLHTDEGLAGLGAPQLGLELDPAVFTRPDVLIQSVGNNFGNNDGESVF